MDAIKDSRRKEGPHNQSLKNAIRHLKSIGKIDKAKDIVDYTGYNKATVSEYVRGIVKASEDFEREFEDKFGISLKDFKDAPSSTGYISHAGGSDIPGFDHAAYIKLLEDNDRFFKTEYHNLLLSLNKLMEIGTRSEELIKLNLEHIGNVEALQKGVDPEIVHEQINNQIAGKVEG